MLRLSQAIRLGAMLRPQSFGCSLSADGQTCALGAALDAIGKAGSAYTDAFDYWPACSLYQAHPVTGEDAWSMLSSIRDLNDSYRWTREAIADWVETVEAPAHLNELTETTCC